MNRYRHTHMEWHHKNIPINSLEFESRVNRQVVLWFIMRFSCSPQAITTPAMAVSHIMLEAYKKYILVSLILHGKVQPLPKYTSQIVGRFVKVRKKKAWME